MEWSERRITDTILTLSLVLAEERERRDRLEVQLASAFSEIDRLRAVSVVTGINADGSSGDPDRPGDA